MSTVKTKRIILELDRECNVQAQIIAQVETSFEHVTKKDKSIYGEDAIKHMQHVSTEVQIYPGYDWQKVKELWHEIADSADSIDTK